MVSVIASLPEAEFLAPATAGQGSQWLTDNVRTLDRLLLQLAQDAAQQRRCSLRLQAAVEELIRLSEAALVTTLLDHPLSELHVQIERIHRQLAWVMQVNRKSGRRQAQLHQKLCQVMQWLHGFESETMHPYTTAGNERH